MRGWHFVIPNQFVQAITEGKAVREGVNIISTATRQILGHVQETGLGRQILGGGLGGPLLGVARLLVSTGQLASSVAANIQLD